MLAPGKGDMSYLPCPCSHIPPLSNPGKRTRQRAVSAQHHERGRCPQDLTHLLGVGLGSFTGLGGSSSTDEEDSRLRCLRRRSLCCSSSSSSVLCLARLFGVEHKVVVRLCASQGSYRERDRSALERARGWWKGPFFMGQGQRDTNTRRVLQSVLAPPS